MERIVRSFAFEVLGGPDLDKVAPELARDWWQTIVEAPLTKHASPGGVRISESKRRAAADAQTSSHNTTIRAPQRRGHAPSRGGERGSDHAEKEREGHRVGDRIRVTGIPGLSVAGINMSCCRDVRTFQRIRGCKGEQGRLLATRSPRADQYLSASQEILSCPALIAGRRSAVRFSPAWG